MTTPGPLQDLPRVDERRVAVRVTPDALRQVRGGHPWVFDRSVTSVSHDAAAGALAVVFDDRRRFAAIGLWDPSSAIRVRVLHAGAPRPVDDEFWLERLIAALDRRRLLADDPGTTAYRCVHGENDGFPGLVIDRYDGTAVVKLYTAAWYPHLRDVVGAFLALTSVDTVVLRHGRSVVLPDGSTPATSVVVGSVPASPVPFLEHGLRFEADVLLGQKTGHFLDQRDNRALAGSHAAGADVLDVFCCTGGFSVHAAAGGATTVESVDRSEHALDAARRNVTRNRDRPAVATCTHRVVRADAFGALEQRVAEGRRYGLVVVDPPSFASRAGQVRAALEAYGRLTRLGLAVTAPGGVFVQSSCSSRVTVDDFHRTVRTAARDTGRTIEELARTGHPVDHPVSYPEGRYLETMFVRARD